MTHEEMLKELQADVDAWPQRVKDAGVKNKAGSAYRPVARNNEVLRTPDDPQATYEYMLRAWEDGPSDNEGSDGWYRIIHQAGPELTWEWFIADETKPYAALFPDELREQRARRAGGRRGNDRMAAGIGSSARRPATLRPSGSALIQEEMKSGKRSRKFI